MGVEHGKIETPLGADEAVERLATMSKRGKLPGFERGGHGGLFSVTAFGTYFDRVLVGEGAEGTGGASIRMHSVLPWKMPALIIFVFVLTIWPGVWFTDEMLVTYWGWYAAKVVEMPWLTYAWYLPLTVIPLPWTYWSALKKSNAAAAASARELMGKMAAALDGRLVEA